jgi:vancomycin resistance protein YoaR
MYGRKKNGIITLILALSLLCIIGFWMAEHGGHTPIKIKDKGIFVPGISGVGGSEEAPSGHIYAGVHAGDIDISGLTVPEAEYAINDYIAKLGETELTFVVAGDNEVKLKLKDLEPQWGNPEVVNDLDDLTDRSSDVISRYRMKKDVETGGRDIPIDIKLDKGFIMNWLMMNCSIYDTQTENATLKRVDGHFEIVGGENGEGVNVSEAANMISNTVVDACKSGNTRLTLPLEEILPQTGDETLLMVKDLLGSFTTSYSSSGANRSKNVANGCRLIDGTTLYPGEEFSAYNAVKPFTVANGYELAGSYVAGQVVDTVGGGICQVSSTLYNAVLRAELEVVERNNHSLIVTYVDKSADAAISESSHKDFRFKNNTEYPIYIEGYTEGKKITFNIYGVETRPSNRKVSYESEVLEEKVLPDMIVGDASLPAGMVSVTGAHKGYKAKLWKVVTVDGKETERTLVNSSNYTPTPRTAIVGIGSADASQTARMQEAIASGNIDVCKAVAGQIVAEFAASNSKPAQQVTEVPESQNDSIAP